MDPAPAQEKIRDQYQRTLIANRDLAKQVLCVSKKLGHDVFLDGFLKYDTNVGTYGNKIYEDVAVKAGMYFKYFIKESYQSERQEILSNMIRSCAGIKTIVDVGFAVPAKYVLENLNKRKEVHMTLLDKFSSSITFSEALLSCVDQNWKKQISINTFDMDEGISPGSFDLYIFMDALEHTKDPSSYLKTVIDSAPPNAYFIFSLPVEQIEVAGGSEGDPMHFIQFNSDEEIRVWLKGHNLKIIEDKITRPKAGDVWLPVEGTFYNLIIKAQKA